MNLPSPVVLKRPVSTGQIRELMRTIPSWNRILPKMSDDALFQEVGIDSLALLELVGELQGATGLEFPDEDIEQISTIANVVRYLNERMQ